MENRHDLITSGDLLRVQITLGGVSPPQVAFDSMMVSVGSIGLKNGTPGCHLRSNRVQSYEQVRRIGSTCTGYINIFLGVR